MVAARVAVSLDARLVLFVVPTLDLAGQTALAWRVDARSEPIVILSSMDASGHDALVAAHVTSASQASPLALLMSAVAEGRNEIPAATVIRTYDSLDFLVREHAAHRVRRPGLRPGRPDEAHRIAGRTE